MTPATPRPYPETSNDPTDCLTIESTVAPASNQSDSQVTIQQQPQPVPEVTTVLVRG
jgi:hypothetical protein